MSEVREVRDRGSQDRTTEFELTPSGSIDAETITDGQNRFRFDNTYVGDQLRLREAYVPDGAGWKLTPEPQDDFRYWYDALTGSLDCVTLISGGDVDQDCNAREGAPVSAELVEDYAYDDDDKLSSSRKWDPARGLDPDGDDEQPTHVGVYEYDALDRPVSEHEHHPYKGRWSQPRLTRFSYLGTTDSVSQEQQYKVATLNTPAADGQLDETKTYSYDPGGWRGGLTDVKKGQNGAPDETRNYLYGYDPHNNVSQLLSESGAIKASYGYSVYGEKDDTETAELKHDGTPGDDKEQFTDDLSPLNPYRYSDKRYDSGSGQLDMGARRFGPSVGQFLQEDVLKDALGELGLGTDPLTQNRYSLAAGNPISFIEADGHMPIPVDGEDARKIGRRMASAGTQMMQQDAARTSAPRRTSTYTPNVRYTPSPRSDAAQGTEPGRPTLRTLTKQALAHPDPPGQGEGLGTFFKGLDIATTLTGLAGLGKATLREAIEQCVRRCDELARTVAGAVRSEGARTTAAKGPRVLDRLADGAVRFGARRGRAPEFPGGRLTEDQALDAATRWLGVGYREVSPGRFLSADRLRQFRYGRHEVRSRTHHIHFEALENGRVVENTRVEIIP